MEIDDIENKNKEIIDIAIKNMSNINDSEHDLNHMWDVVNYTKRLLNCNNINVDKEVCIIAAYWHDVGRSKINIGHEKLSAQMLKEEMKKRNYSNNLIEECYKAIEFHAWNMIPTTTEGYLIRDADKLGWLGKGRWKKCLNTNTKLDSIIELLGKLKHEILYFDDSKKIYDEEIIELVRILYNQIYNNS